MKGSDIFTEIHLLIHFFLDVVVEVACHHDVHPVHRYDHHDLVDHQTIEDVVVHHYHQYVRSHLH